jgi:2-polyprenyl-6-methoxyphenol hydroxylase-like FAD-dependent oxidoreductase
VRVACVGGGPGGLFAAVLLKQLPGVDGVTVYERSPEGVTHGWGVVFWDDLLDQLEIHDAPTAAAVRAQAFTWTDQVIEVAGEQVNVGGHGYAMSRRALRGLLTDRARAVGVDVRFGEPVEDPAEVLAENDVVVAADGVHSVLRGTSSTFGTSVARGRNKFVWLGTDAVFGSFTFPFVRTEAGWLWAHAYGYDEHGSTFVVETNPRTWTQLGFAELDTDATMRKLEGIFADQLDGHTLRPPGPTDGPTPWQEFSTVRNQRWVDGRLVLLGDAAHTTHFTIGSGTRLALLDAMALAVELRAHPDRIDAGLAAYQQRRIAELADVAAEADASERWFAEVERYLGYGARAFAQLLVDRRHLIARRLPGVYIGARRLRRTLANGPLGTPVRVVTAKLRRTRSG